MITWLNINTKTSLHSYGQAKNKLALDAKQANTTRTAHHENMKYAKLMLTYNMLGRIQVR
jgi:hypothetical protein